jgi:hypothetical protein
MALSCSKTSKSAIKMKVLMLSMHDEGLLPFGPCGLARRATS